MIDLLLQIKLHFVIWSLNRVHSFTPVNTFYNKLSKKRHKLLNNFKTTCIKTSQIAATKSKHTQQKLLSRLQYIYWYQCRDSR